MRLSWALPCCCFLSFLSLRAAHQLLGSLAVSLSIKPEKPHPQAKQKMATLPLPAADFLLFQPHSCHDMNGMELYGARNSIPFLYNHNELITV